MSKLPVGVQEYALGELERARAELATTETPWEPYDTLDRVINDIMVVDEYVWLGIPWTHVTAFLKVVERAKDSCYPSVTHEMVGVMTRIEIAIEKRGPIDRLGDLVA